MSRAGGESAEELAGAIRELIEHMMAFESAPGATAAAAQTVRSVTNALKTAGGKPRLPLTQAPDGDVAAFFRFSPVSGPSNPIAPPARLEIQGQQVVGTVTFNSAYEGPPGYVHGAFVAAVFDELLGITNAVLGLPAMTGLLEVRYHRPTPLDKEIRLVGRHVELAGRKSIATGEFYDGDTLLAEGKGTFIAVKPAQALELFGAQLEQIEANRETTDGSLPAEK
ncbi:MAG: PaaI family thioesterase [Candidatus Dormiibacterota bacterium]